VLLVHDRHDPASRFSQYLLELLRVEGFAAVDEIELDALGDTLAITPDLVVLPRLALPADLADRLLAWVRDGGRLVALQPDAPLLRKLGLRPTYSTIRNGIVTFADGGMLDGLPLDPVQVIVPAMTMVPDDDAAATELARAGSSTDIMSGTGAIHHLRIGSGEAVVFGFDLAGAVARLRHGDPELVDIPNHRWDHITRPSDLFAGQLDIRQARIPQADVLTAVLGRVIESLAPQPRLWYYPAADQRGVLVMTSDDDWSTLGQFEVMVDVLRQYEATCTFYVVHSSVLTPGHMDAWEQDGHVFSVHPAMGADTKGANPVDEHQRRWVPQMVRDNVARHREQYGRPVNTIRNHAIRWVGYVDLARLHAELGIRAEANYVTVGLTNVGWMTGSGRLARFVDTTGEMIDHYQISTHWTEEALVSSGHSSSERWQYQRAQEATNDIIVRGIERYHTPVTLNSHPVSFATYSQPLIESNWKTAREHGASIVAADHWTAWTDRRNGVRIARENGHWTVSSASAIDRLTLLCPEGSYPSGAGMSTTTQVIWGKAYTARELTGLAAGEQRTIQTGALETTSR
jgi:predicted transcriptional regulator